MEHVQEPFETDPPNPQSGTPVQQFAKSDTVIWVGGRHLGMSI